jgi:hypothetical protein
LSSENIDILDKNIVILKIVPQTGSDPLKKYRNLFQNTFFHSPTPRRGQLYGEKLQLLSCRGVFTADLHRRDYGWATTPMGETWIDEGPFGAPAASLASCAFICS